MVEKLVQDKPEETEKKQSCFRENWRYMLTAALMILELPLKICVYIYGGSILTSVKANMSLAQPFDGKFDALFYLFGCFNMLFSVLGTWLKYPFYGKMCFYNDSVSAVFMVLDVSNGMLVYSTLACLNQDMGSLETIYVHLVYLYVFIEYASLLLSCYTVFKDNAEDLILHAICCVFLALAIGSMLVMNVKLIAKDKPLSYGQISPRHIHMAFFNQSEIIKIQNGVYKRDATFESRLVGRLSDVVESNHTMPGSFECKCSSVDTWLIYNLDIKCTPENRLMYADCANNATTLSIGTRHLKYSNDFPSYTCEVNLDEESLCMTKCERLYASKYELILIQLRDGRVEPAWTGLSSCNAYPNFRLIRNDSFSPCVRYSSSNSRLTYSKTAFFAAISVYLYLK